MSKKGCQIETRYKRPNYNALVHKVSLAKHNKLAFQIIKEMEHHHKQTHLCAHILFSKGHISNHIRNITSP